MLDECCVLHVMGKHGGESNGKIFARKQLDIEKTDTTSRGHTVWVTTMAGDRLNSILALLAKQQIVYVYFIEPFSSGDGGTKDFKSDGGPPPAATKYRSISGLASSFISTEWTPLPDKLGPVTGKAERDCDRKAMIFTELTYNVHNMNEVELPRMANLDASGQPGYRIILNAGGNCKQAVKYMAEVVPPDPSKKQAMAGNRKVWARAKLVDIVDLEFPTTSFGSSKRKRKSD